MRNRTLSARCLAALALCCCLHSLPAADSLIVVGREDGWRDFTRMENLAPRPGRWGTTDLYLRDNARAVTGRTDLLLHFDAAPWREEAGLYTIQADGARPSARFYKLGGGSAAFTGSEGPLRLLPGPGSLFAPATWMGDFSIEFWLLPALLDDGEELVTWSGARWRGSLPLAQALRCTVRDRRLLWRFENLFTNAAGDTTSLSLHGVTPLVPRDWHHHLLRYDSRLGMLEYLVDGLPEAIAYATETGTERGSPWLPFAGDARPGSLEIGARFTGFIDELHLLRGFAEAARTARYADLAGSAQSEPFDLGYTGTRLKRVEAVYRTPADSAVLFYYRTYDRLADRDDTAGAPWRQFLPGTELEQARGRYLQLMVELHPDGAGRHSPEVSELRAVYEQDLPPSPPAGLRAVAGNGSVRLYWRTVNQPDVRGYLVYYGERPGNYHGTDSDRGRSPIDVGNVSEAELTGLANGKLYHFSVVAYDSAEPPHRSLFAREVSARPSAVIPPNPEVTLASGDPRPMP